MSANKGQGDSLVTGCVIVGCIIGIVTGSWVVGVVAAFAAGALADGGKSNRIDDRRK